MNAPANLQNPIKPWEHETWTPEPLFKGQTVFCLASGPSLTQELCDTLRGRAAIVVNASFRLAPWAAVWFFTDTGIYERYKDDVERWPGLVVTLSRKTKRELDAPDQVAARGFERIKRVKGYGAPPYPPRWNHRPGFAPLGNPEIQQGRNSGNTAASLAIAMGATTVALLGYDCRVVNGREHHHNDYAGPRDLNLYESEFLRGFDGWNEAALASGVTILNCTPGSAITEFPFVALDELL